MLVFKDLLVIMQSDAEISCDLSVRLVQLLQDQIRLRGDRVAGHSSLQVDALHGPGHRSRPGVQRDLRAVPPTQTHSQAQSRVLTEQGPPKGPSTVAIAIAIAVHMSRSTAIGRRSSVHAQLPEEVVLGDGLLEEMRSFDALREARKGIRGVLELQQATGQTVGVHEGIAIVVVG